MAMCTRKTGVVCLASAVMLMWMVATAQAQVPSGRLLLTVVDQTGAVLPAATVTVRGEDAAPFAAATASATTSEAGVASVTGLAAGRYTVQVEFSGFETVTLRNLRVGSGEVRRTVTLPLQKVADEVTVGRDGRTSALDPRGAAFSTILTREMIEALPDGPEEMEAVLKAMSPPGAQIRIDGFTGGQMPPKSQIRSIRLPRMDQYAAQNHGGMSGGLLHIDIMTMPGAGPLRGSVDTSFNDDAMNARNPFTPTKGDEQLRQYGASLSGTIRPNKTSFSFSAGGATQYTSPNLLAVLPDGTTTVDTLRTPTETMNASLRLDHALNPDHAVRMSLSRTERETRNMGVGGFNLLERAYASESATTTLRLSENGPIGRRMFSESRVQLVWGSQSARSVLDAPTYRVLDAFTAGGAQQRGGQSRFDFEVATDLDYVRGAHSWRTGVLVEGGRYTSDDMANYLGTYTFASLDDYRAGRPMSYSRRLGDPNLRYSRWQAGVYVQDDWRMSRSLLVSLGLRAGVHSLTDDQFNLSPRLNLAWSPLRTGRLTLRGGYGYFYDWINSELYKQTLQIDGVRQQELNVLNPSFPEAPQDGPSTVTNQYLWTDELALPAGHRAFVGADFTLTPNQRVNVSYNRTWGAGQLRGRNLNAPIDGVRPDQAFANRLTMVADAESRSHSVNANWNLTKFDWKQSFFFVNYTWTTAETNTTGAFSVPANGDTLDTEWGPSTGDIRHRVGASFSMRPVGALSISVNARAQSGSPYNITTGRDDNGDGLFNDRPDGVTRNSARTAAQWDLGGRLAYSWGFGTRSQGGGGGGGTVVIGGGMASGFAGGASNSRIRVEVYVSGQNLLNRANYVGYSGVVTSPFFGQPTNVMNPRRVQTGLRISF